MSADSYAGDLDPKKAWDILSEDANAVLVDVRTRAEWAFVGVPELAGIGKEVVFIEWQAYPTMEQNPNFADELRAAGLAEAATVLFICRSGARSQAAAICATAAGFATAYNVSEGFEGNQDEHGHRGVREGWKARGLSWSQK